MTKIYPLNLDVMASNMQLLEQFVDTKALEPNFETINLHVEKIWIELSACNENVYHHFVEAKMSNYEPPHKLVVHAQWVM
jgi:hypothetical protein